MRSWSGYGSRPPRFSSSCRLSPRHVRPRKTQTSLPRHIPFPPLPASMPQTSDVQIVLSPNPHTMQLTAVRMVADITPNRSRRSSATSLLTATTTWVFILGQPPRRLDLPVGPSSTVGDLRVCAAQALRLEDPSDAMVVDSGSGKACVRGLGEGGGPNKVWWEGWTAR